MDETLSMRRSQPRRGLHPDAKNLLEVERSFRVELLLQRHSGDELHHDLGLFGRLVDRVDRDDVIVTDRGDGLRLTNESLASQRVVSQIRGQYFHGDHSMQRRIECFQHDTHAASPHDFRNLVHTEFSN